MHPLLAKLGLSLPIVQAPMAGTSTPALAAAVCGAGGLGSIALGAVDAEAGRAMIRATREATGRAFAVNLFCHAPARADPDREAAWLSALAPEFARFGATPPDRLREIYTSFVTDDAMLAMLLDERPHVVSVHFGLPPADRIAALQANGAVLVATATSPGEAQAIVDAGIDAIVAQGYEAGGHRGIFDPDGTDDRLGTMALTRLLARTMPIPVIAAGGIMDGTGIAAALALGAAAAQLGTAFVGCPESAADPAYRATLSSDAAAHTIMTHAISGRPARCLANRFTALGERLDRSPPAYPRAYDAGKALDAAARIAGDAGYGAQWAGQGAPLARALPAAELVAQLGRELAAARAGG